MIKNDSRFSDIKVLSIDKLYTAGGQAVLAKKNELLIKVAVNCVS